MDYQDVWNDICFKIKDKYHNVSEREFQLIAESLFEKLGWSQRKDEIITQKTILIGSAQSIKPDIIIQKDNERLFVVELKKPNSPITDRNSLQLFSYMRQLKCDFGILLGETIQLYYESPNDTKPPILIDTIEFNNDSETGMNFIKLISKEECSKEKITDYCSKIITEELNKEKSEKYIKLLCSQTGQEILYKILEEKLLIDFSDNEYANDIVENILDDIEIKITRKSVIQPSNQNNNQTIQNNNSIKSTKKMNRLNSTGAIRLCETNGINLRNENRTYASKNTVADTYWANPLVDYLLNDWWLLLDDYKKGKLYVFKIPANSINRNDIEIRVIEQKENDEIIIRIIKIDFQIKYNDENFEDNRSHITLRKYLVRTIEYPIK
jgi:hypothetical protein